MVIKIHTVDVQSDHHLYSMEFRVGSQMRYIPGMGKHWPLITQCLFYCDGLVLAFAEVVKHGNDEDNPQYAKIAVAKKIFEQRPMWKELRVKFWQRLRPFE